MAQSSQSGSDARSGTDSFRSGDRSAGPMTVLVVDPDSDLREYLRRCLDQFGPLFGRILEASNGLEALSAAKVGAVDLMICGADLAQLGTLALCGALRADASTAAMLIVVLASADTDVGEMKKPSGDRLIDAFLSVPFNAADVGVCLGNLVPLL